MKKSILSKRQRDERINIISFEVQDKNIKNKLTESSQKL